MKIEQIYTGCLSQAAYYIESKGEAAVIDPLRDTQAHLTKAAQDGASIRYIFETHFHADFVSGHLELADATGADIVFGPNAETTYPAHIAADGEVFMIGELTLEVLHTPGHTLESVCYLLKDSKGKALALFTGDTLFIGDVGRPDVAQRDDGTLSSELLAGMLYESLVQKILPLPDDVLIYPAHGAGSACGKHMSKETFDTLGNQKRLNYALQTMEKNAFVQAVLQGLPPAPAYFVQNVQLNRAGYEPVDQVLARALKALDADAFECMRHTGEYVVLDTRAAGSFAEAHIPGSINIGIKGSFAPWVGALIEDIHQPLLIVADAGMEQEVALRLARVGFHNSFGYLSGGLQTWIARGFAVDTVASISGEAFMSAYADGQVKVLDVRSQGEYDKEHLIGAESMPLASYKQFIAAVEEEQDCYVYCAGGYRSMMFISLMKQAGVTANMVNVNGGMAALKALSNNKHV
ncbi:rhodanese-like domain-containing protein [Olivibacter sp. XZL3]|uniref:MBL fold metallo-hydrolase n=1 Tax=Olivibacter sp. XZL3 TaxID=1735116 RepID=UPI0010665BE0|nr:MBL fold metallo-hydrolase [Olivibacter sp. XZL3]